MTASEIPLLQLQRTDRVDYGGLLRLRNCVDRLSIGLVHCSTNSIIMQPPPPSLAVEELTRYSHFDMWIAALESGDSPRFECCRFDLEWRLDSRSPAALDLPADTLITATYSWRWRVNGFVGGRPRIQRSIYTSYKKALNSYFRRSITICYKKHGKTYDSS